MRRIKTVLGVVGVLAFATSAMAANLTNGDFEGGFTSGVGNSWTSYQGGNLNAECTFSEGAGDGGGSSQNIYRALIRDDRWQGVLQTVDANVGDAFTFTARSWCDATAGGHYGVIMALRAGWAGGTDRDAAEVVAVSVRPSTSTWYDTGPGAGNATGTAVTLFCDTVGTGGKVEPGANMRWDNVIAYRSHVPPAPSAGNESVSTIDVDVDPGGNAGNALAEFAISIGGGMYTLGSDWVQSDGSVLGSGAWQTDPTWGTVTVTGLDPGTEYTFQGMARYSSTITQPTFLGAGGVATTLPEPATVILLGFGCLLLRRRRL